MRTRRSPKIPIKEYFWSKVQKTDGCWLWTGTINSEGYGQISLNGRNVSVHRLAYIWLVEPIPLGLELDHLCRIRHCVFPQHLEVVTRKVNVLRGISPSANHAKQQRCIHGHLFDMANTYLIPGGRRQCIKCRKATDRRRRANMTIEERRLKWREEKRRYRASNQAWLDEPMQKAQP